MYAQVNTHTHKYVHASTCTYILQALKSSQEGVHMCFSLHMQASTLGLLHQPCSLGDSLDGNGTQCTKQCTVFFIAIIQ